MKLSSKYKKIIFIEIIFIIGFPLLLKTPLLRSISVFFNASDYFVIFFKFLFFFRVALLVHLLILILKLFYYNVIKQNVHENSENKKLLITSLLSCFIVLEIIFTFVPQSQGNFEIGFGQSLWDEYYDKPLNELKYRDLDFTNRINTTRKKIFFLGDSFTRGVGIKNSKNCFTSIIKSRLDTSKFEVFNLGKGNSDTKDELKRLKAFPILPDLVVLQYYHNDIQPVAQEFGYYTAKNNGVLKRIMAGAIYVISKTSFFLNFVVINVSVKFANARIGNEYKKEIRKSYADINCLNAHFNDIRNIIYYCKSKKIKLYVLLVPELVNVNFTEEICFSPLKLFLEKNNIEYVSLYNELKLYEPRQLIVGPLDNHANELVQKIIADKILISVPELK